MKQRAFHIAHIAPPAGDRSLMHGLNGYLEVVETLTWGLAELGYEVSAGPNSFRGDRVNILIGAQMLSEADLARLPPETIVYNFEQIGGMTVDRLKPNIRIVADRFRIWDYSNANLATWRAIGTAREAINVPIGWAPVLERIPPATQDIDVLIYGSPGPLRLSLFSDLCQRGLQCMFVCGLYGASRDGLVARSKIVLNISKHVSRIFEIVRVSYLLANGKAVVADRQPDTFVEDGIEAAVAFCAPEAVVGHCVRLLDSEPERRELESRGRAIMQGRVVTKYLSAALAREESA